jgi:hypothetical protein
VLGVGSRSWISEQNTCAVLLVALVTCDDSAFDHCDLEVCCEHPWNVRYAAGLDEICISLCICPYEESFAKESTRCDMSIS